VIRFNCTNCGRYYELPNAMRLLPLLCKGCGQPLDVPEPTPDPEPTKTTETPPPSPKPPIHPIVPLSKSNDKPATAMIEETAEVLGSKPVSKPEILALETPIVPTPPSPVDNLAETPETGIGMKPLSIVVDVMVGLVLLVLGGLLGEALAGKSTGDVWRDAATAPKFPPIDLLMWLAPPVMLGLIYGLLISRRKSLGCWLQRRNES